MWREARMHASLHKKLLSTLAGLLTKNLEDPLH